jgi:hypothetical protein
MNVVTWGADVSGVDHLKLQPKQDEVTKMQPKLWPIHLGTVSTTPQLCYKHPTKFNVKDFSNDLLSEKLFDKHWKICTLSISIPLLPIRKQKACNGAVRNIVNWLPLWWVESPLNTTAEDRELGDNSMAVVSPLSAPWIDCTYKCIIDN